MTDLVKQATPIKEKPVCTKENPAPKGRLNPNYYGDHNKYKWDWSYDHPDAIGVCISEDYDDWRYNCPHCGCYHIYEGPDA